MYKVSRELIVVLIAVFTHGPQGPGPRVANFQGRHIKKEIEIEIGYVEKKGCPRERNLREIYTEEVDVSTVVGLYTSLVAFLDEMGKVFQSL